MCLSLKIIGVPPPHPLTEKAKQRKEKKRKVNAFVDNQKYNRKCNMFSSLLDFLSAVPAAQSLTDFYHMYPDSYWPKEPPLSQ